MGRNLKVMERGKGSRFDGLAAEVNPGLYRIS